MSVMLVLGLSPISAFAESTRITQGTADTQLIQDEGANAASVDQGVQESTRALESADQGLSLQGEKTSEGTRVDLNGTWSFYDPATGDTKSVTVPHSWTYLISTFNPMANIKTYVYKRTVDVSSYQGNRILLHFDGVNKIAKVSVDGTEVGTHTGGFSAFAFDITEACAGKTSVEVSVEVTNMSFSTMPINTDFTHYAGIYRDAYLTIGSPIASISNMDYGSNGIYAASSVNLKTGTAKLTPTVMVDYDTTYLAAEGEGVVVSATLKDADGKEVATGTKTVATADPVSARSGEGTSKVIAEKVVMDTMSVSNAHLWNGTIDPYRYTLDVNVSVDGTVVDTQTTYVGFRAFETKGGTFYLNGKPYELHGVGMHQEIRAETNVTTSEERQADIQTILEMGANALRTCHYPHNQEIYDLCDEYGIVVWSEIPFYLVMLNTDAFKQNTIDSALEMVKQGFNHPSIIVWGIQNEVNYYAEYQKYYPTQANPEQIAVFMKELSEAVRDADSSRFIGEAEINSYSFAKETATWTTSDSGINVVGLNLYSGWYSGSTHAPTFKNALNHIEGIQDMAEGYAKIFTKSSDGTASAVISEYGAGANINQHSSLDSSFRWGGAGNSDGTNYVSKGNFHPEEFQSYVHEMNYMAYYGDKTNKVSRTDSVWAAFAWTMFDFGCYRSEGGTQYLNTKGLVASDHTTKKDAFYFYKANWNTTDKFTHICSSRFTERTSNIIDVKVYSNCEAVKLYVNGKDLGRGTKQQDGVFVWENVEIKQSGNEVVAKGLVGNNAVCKDTCDTWTYTAPEIASLATISSALDTNKVIDVANGSTSRGANAQIYADNKSFAQRWSLTDAGDGYYYITSVASGLVLDVASAGMTSGTNVQLWSKNGSDAQKWAIVKLEDQEGLYEIVSKLNGLRLDVSGGKSNNGTNIQVYKKNGTASQQFVLNEVAPTIDNGIYVVKSALSSNVALDIAGASSSKGANAQIYKANGTLAQSFEFTYSKSTGYYTIRNSKSGYVLDVAGASSSKGANIQQYSSNGTKAQRWVVEPHQQADGTVAYVIYTAIGNGYCMDVSGASTRNGANVQTYSPNGTKAQMWILVPSKK